MRLIATTTFTISNNDGDKLATKPEIALLFILPEISRAI